MMPHCIIAPDFSEYLTVSFNIPVNYYAETLLAYSEVHAMTGFLLVLVQYSA